MASATHTGDFDRCDDRAGHVATSVGARLKRLAHRLDGAFETRRRKAFDQEIARLLAQSGGRLTDSLEREIMRKVFASDWNLPD